MLIIVCFWVILLLSMSFNIIITFCVADATVNAVAVFRFVQFLVYRFPSLLIIDQFLKKSWRVGGR